MQALNIEGVFAEQYGLQIALDVDFDRFDRVPTPWRRRYGLADAGNALIGPHLYHHGIGRGRDAVSSSKIAASRDLDNGGVNLGDFHFVLHRYFFRNCKLDQLADTVQMFQSIDAIQQLAYLLVR